MPAQAPPSYDAAVNGGPGACLLRRTAPRISLLRPQCTVSGPFVSEGASKGQDVKVPPPPSPGMFAGPPPPPSAQVPATVVYNYVNPISGERIVSLLPPDHPQMVCLQQGGHVSTSKFGILGESLMTRTLPRAAQED